MKLCKRVKKVKTDKKEYEIKQNFINIPNLIINQLEWNDDEQLVCMANPTNKMLMVIPLSTYNSCEIDNLVCLLDDVFKSKGDKK